MAGARGESVEEVNIKISNFLPIWSLNSSISSDIFSL